jgi:hypothetical protein
VGRRAAPDSVDAGTPKKVSMTTVALQAAIQIVKWRGCAKNTLVGFVDVHLASGLLIRGITVHQKGDRRWLGLPARSYETDSGATAWSPVVEIPDHETRERFERLVLEALDQFLRRAK